MSPSVSPSTATDALRRIMAPMAEAESASSVDLAASRRNYAEFLQVRDASAAAFFELAARAGNYSPRSRGFFQQVTLMPGPARHRPVEVPSPMGDDAALARTVAEASILYAQAACTRTEQGALPLAERLEHLYKALKIVEQAYGAFSPDTHAVRKKLLLALVEDQDYDAARFQFHRLFECEGWLKNPEDTEIANNAHRFFDAVDLQPDEEARRDAAREAAVCLRYALRTASADGTKDLLKRVRELERIANPEDVAAFAPHNAVTADKTWQSQIEQIIAELHGPYAGLYREEAQQQLQTALTGTHENARNSKVWLDNFTKLVAYQKVAAPDVQNGGAGDAADQDVEHKLKAAEQAFERVVGHGKAKRVLKAILNKRLRGFEKGSVICLDGPSGNGKSTMGRIVGEVLSGADSVYRINFGNHSDKAGLEGHGNVYVSARPSPYAEALMKRGTNRVVFLLEEIDKASGGIQSALAALLELDDPIVDSYFRLPLDLSKAFFICTMNDKKHFSDHSGLIPHLANRLGPCTVHTGPLSTSAKRMVVAAMAPESMREVGCQIGVSASAINYIAARSKGDPGARGIREDLARLAAHARLRRDRGDAFAFVDAKYAMEILEERWQTVVHKGAAVEAEFGCLAQEEDLGEAPQIFSFVQGNRTWEFHIAKDGCSLLLKAGDGGQFRVSLTLGAETTPFSEVPKTDVLAAGQVLHWAWPDANVWARLSPQERARLMPQPDERLIGCRLRIGAAAMR